MNIDEVFTYIWNQAMNSDPLTEDVLSRAGWEFKTDEYIHPHCNSPQTEKKFRSPRMKYFCSFEPNENVSFLDLEAKAMATEYLHENLQVVKTKLVEAAENYFRNTRGNSKPAIERVVLRHVFV